MENKKMETFGSRLAYLIESKGMDATSRHTVPIIAQKMVDDGVTKTDDPNSVAAVIRKHLRTAQACDVKMCYLIAYHDFFECSYDFLMGDIDHPTHEKTDIHETTGLSDEAIENILELVEFDKAAAANEKDAHLINTLDSVLSHKGMDIFIDAIYEYMHSDYTIPAYHENAGEIKPLPNPLDSGAYTPGGGGTVTLLKSKDDPTDNIRIHIDREFLETVAQNKIMWHLAHIKRGLL